MWFYRDFGSNRYGPFKSEEIAWQEIKRVKGDGA
jgi:hypothetical protein